MAAGDDVEVEVGDGLAGGGAVVEADGVAVGGEAGVDESLGVREGGYQGFALGGLEIAPGGDVAMGRDEEVAGGHGISVPDPFHQGADEGDRFDGRKAEWAGRGSQGRVAIREGREGVAQ